MVGVEQTLFLIDIGIGKFPFELNIREFHFGESGVKIHWVIAGADASLAGDNAKAIGKGVANHLADRWGIIHDEKRKFFGQGLNVFHKIFHKIYYHIYHLLFY